MLNGDKSSDQDILDLQEETEKLQPDESIFCTVKAEEVPPVPENRFLMRANQTAVSTNENNSGKDVSTQHLNGTNKEKRDRNNDRKLVF